MWEALGSLLNCLFGENSTINNYTYVYVNEDPEEKNNNLYYLMAELG
jgi:hypothetical protein